MKPTVGDFDPVMHPCAAVPDLAAWMGPRPGSARSKTKRILRTLPCGCPRVEPTTNWPCCWQHEPAALKGRRAERVIFGGAGRRPAAGWPRRRTRRLRPRLAVWCSLRAATAHRKKRCRPTGSGQQVPMAMRRNKKKLFYGDGSSIDFRGHLAVRRFTRASPSAAPANDNHTPNASHWPAPYSSPDGPYMPGTGMSFSRR